MSKAHKINECKLGRRFRAAWRGQPGIVSLHLFEGPDLLGLLTSGRRVGIEVVTLTDTVLAHGRELSEEKLSDELREAARSAGFDVIFSLHLDEHEAIRLQDKTMRKRLITDLVAFAQDAPGGQSFASSERLEALGIEGIDCIGVDPGSGEGPDVIIARHARGRGWTDVRQRIAEKDEKIGTYRERIGAAPELWLLLETGFSFESNVVLSPSHPPFVTSFDRVFLLDGWPVRAGKGPDRLIELAIRQRE